MRPLCTALLATLLGCAGLLAAHSWVKIDNSDVRVVSVTDFPHRKSAMHQHDFNRVMIYLDGGDLTLVSEDGHVDAQHWKSGQVAWSPAGGRHTSENVGSTVIRIVEIELKKPAPAVAPVRERKLDPVRIDPQHNILLFENDQVRVFRNWLEPDASEPMHEHVGAGSVDVLLTDIDASVAFGNGTAGDLHGWVGDVFWSQPVKHMNTNGSFRYEMDVVEVK